MSPRTADPAVREALVEAAAAMIARHEPLTTRALASEVGTSTMAVYTHFGGLEQLRRAVRRAGFERLREHLNRTADTEDPVADLGVLGWGYCMNALENPNLYRAMFMEAPLDEEDASVGLDTFERLVRGVQRCIDAGRFGSADAWDIATEMWAMVHGAVALHLAGMLDQSEVLRITTGTARAYFVAYGDERESVERSLVKVAERMAATDWEPPAQQEPVMKHLKPR